MLMPLKRYSIRIVFLFVIIVFLQNCSAVYINKEVSTIKRSNMVMGYVCSTPSWAGTVVVTAFSKEKGKIDVGDYTVLHEPGPFELVALHDSFHIFAFGDRNHNLVYDDGEPAGQYCHNITPTITDDAPAMNLDICLSMENASSVDFPMGMAISKIAPEKLYSSLPGAIIKLEDDIFSEKNGGKGYWAPMAFFKDIGANIYFLDGYDPAKIPVLFIHGATGSPRGWRYFIENMDLDRFQPWLFYYPSGAPLESISHLLYRKLIYLQKQYHFEHLYITAHSMGGLVARSLILNSGESLPVTQLFIAISTPWGGDKMAGYGVKQSPVVIPCWRDLQPDGVFLKSLYASAMPKETEFHIFFGHKGNRNPLRSNNDGTLSLASMLDLRSQSEADGVYGFNQDHESIIYSKEALLQYNAILGMNDKKRLNE